MQTLFSKNVSGMADQSRLRLILKFKMAKIGKSARKLPFNFPFLRESLV